MNLSFCIPTEYIKRNTRLDKIIGEDTQQRTDIQDSIKSETKPTDFFETEFKQDSTKVGEKLMGAKVQTRDDVLNRMRVFPYKKKYFVWTTIC